jgi:hypothetical protein
MPSIFARRLTVRPALTSITIRRGATTLVAQNVRIERVATQGQPAEGQGTQASKGRVVVVGSLTLNIQPGDRFNDDAGALYQVVMVQPNRRAAVIAEAELME